MSTYLEIRQEILGMLDVKPTASTDSDIRNLVDTKVQRLRDRVFEMRQPRKLLKVSAATTIDEDTLAVKLYGAAATNYPSFVLTDYKKLFSFTVEEEDWAFIPYPTWIRLNNSVGGNQRPAKSYTIDHQDFIYTDTLPSGTETWDVQVYYYATPAAYADGTECELGEEFEQILTLGVATQFPNMFQGEERLALLQSYRQDYKAALSEYLRADETAKSDLRLRPAIRNRRGRSAIQWGTGIY